MCEVLGVWQRIVMAPAVPGKYQKEEKGTMVFFKVGIWGQRGPGSEGEWVSGKGREGRQEDVRETPATEASFGHPELLSANVSMRSLG